MARRENGQHAVPQVGGVGIAVEQQHRRPGAALADEDPCAVDGDSGLAVHGVIVPPDGGPAAHVIQRDVPYAGGAEV